MTVILSYAVTLFVASWLGGWLPRRYQFSHTQTQLVMSLVAGLMLGVAGFHLIPHSVELGQSIDLTMYFVVGGLVFMLLLLRLFHFHQHDIPIEGEPCAHVNEHDHAHSHSQAYDQAPVPRDVGWMGLFLGLSIHTILDGIALGAILRVEQATVLLPGLGVFAAILLHKPLDSLSIETMMRLDGWSERQRSIVNLIFALLCPLAALVFYLGFSGPIASVLPAALAFSAGAFMCIALADLLPEVQFHSHDKLILTGSFLTGLLIALALGVFEPHFHQ